eukprot:1054489-Amorphochlora_amoeboformis.AAC.1
MSGFDTHSYARDPEITSSTSTTYYPIITGNILQWHGVTLRDVTLVGDLAIMKHPSNVHKLTMFID